jgi:hypothetical protein
MRNSRVTGCVYPGEVRMITALLLLSLTLSDPNAMTVKEFARHWLEPVLVSQSIDPNGIKVIHTQTYTKGNRLRDVTYQVIGWKEYRLFGMSEFADFAQEYPGDPNTPVIKEPNLAEILVGVTDPNLAAAIKTLMKEQP